MSVVTMSIHNFNTSRGPVTAYHSDPMCILLSFCCTIRQQTVIVYRHPTSPCNVTEYEITRKEEIDSHV